MSMANHYNIEGVRRLLAISSSAIDIWLRRQDLDSRAKRTCRVTNMAPENSKADSVASPKRLVLSIQNEAMHSDCQ